jgi:hypothetical protein
LQALLAGSFCCLLLFPHLGYGNAEELVEECKRLLSEGEAEQAERLCQEALTVDPENCEARYGLLLARPVVVERPRTDLAVGRRCASAVVVESRAGPGRRAAAAPG